MREILVSLMLFGFIVIPVAGYSDASNNAPVPATVAIDTAVTPEQDANTPAVSAPVAMPSAPVSAPSEITESVAAQNATKAEMGGPAGPAIPSLPNPYANVSSPEFYLLQQLAAELARAARTGLDEAQANAHEGRYGEDNYLDMQRAFSANAQGLSDALRTAPVDKAKVHASIEAMKVLVLDIDDVFVYNPGFLRQMRNWNECKRILRRIDGAVYREGGLRKLESIWDSNSFLRDMGKMLNAQGLLSNVGDGLHKTNPTGPVDAMVGRHGGGRRVATVWMVPNSIVHGSLQNANSDLNDGLTQ